MSFAEWVMGAFEAVTPDLDSIQASARQNSLGEWQTLQTGLVTASGAAAAAIPGLHLLGVAADVAFLMNRMSVCAFGVGAIMGREANRDSLIEEEDFAVILGKWAGVEGLDNAAIAKASADLVTKVGSKQATKLLAKMMCKNAGILVGKKLSGKMGAKLGAKFGAKLGGKLAGGWIPFLGAAISASINIWFITGTFNAAKDWYQYKAQVE